MRNMNMKRSRRHRPHRQKGSALLVTLMVIAGLSLLGLGFVTISETESAISVNQKHSTQVLQLAEAGARAAVEWFQDPQWCLNHGIMPANVGGIKTPRPFAGVAATYKSIPGTLLFDKPYKTALVDRLLGIEANADIIINDTTLPGFLDTFNEKLFTPTEEPLSDMRVVEIRVFSPPVVGGTAVVGAGGTFWNGSGTRYGVATIAARAQKTIKGRIVAQRTVRIIVSEFPFPGPEGPIQSNTSIDTNGSFEVYWGKVTSRGDIDMNRTTTSIPWLNAYEQVHFERGYGCFATPCDTATALANQPWPMTAVSGDDKNVFAAMLGRDWVDPWFQSRSRGENAGIAGAGPQGGAWDPNDAASDPTVIKTNFWERQDHNDLGTKMYREVIFPVMNYEIWKEIAQTGDGTSGVYYLKWAENTGGAGNPVVWWTNAAGTKRNFAQWVNIKDDDTPAKPGFYFFDSETGSNPQLSTGGTNTAILTDGVAVNSADADPDFQMQGFIYLNDKNFGTSGISGQVPTDYYAMPGEPYRDIGFPATNAAGALIGGTEPDTVSNLTWDYKDLNANGTFDVVTVATTIARPWCANAIPAGGCVAAGDVYTGRMVKVWNPSDPDCTIATIGQAGGCSDPHEPYINLTYPVETTFGHGNVRHEWGGAQRAKAKSGNVPYDCTVGANATDPKKCTSDKYDRDGGLVRLNPVLVGVMYNEGEFGSAGNAPYFGSLIIKGAFGSTGTPTVYFDERLIKNTWEIPGMPRVIISGVDTD